MNRPVLAYAGEVGSFAEDAALAFLPGCTTVSAATFSDVFAIVAEGAADAGVVPIENVTHGTVREVYDLLLEGTLLIVGEIEVPVRLCLAALPGQTLDDITRVYSHVQALGQAEPYLRSRSWTLIASTNTAGAGRAIAQLHERGAAAVLSNRAAATNGLAVLAEGIETHPRNRTRFLVLATTATPWWSTPPDPTRPIRSTLAFGLANRPGALAEVLMVFSQRDLNISKLESRPSPKADWEYVFWVDVDTDVRGDVELMRGVARATAWLRTIGCYPTGDARASA